MTHFNVMQSVADGLGQWIDMLTCKVGQPVEHWKLIPSVMPPLTCTGLSEVQPRSLRQESITLMTELH